MKRSSTSGPRLQETFEFEQPEGSTRCRSTSTSPASSTRAFEMELAQEMLEITNEAELEEFLGKLVRGVARGASSFMKSGVGKAVGGVLRNVAKTALPMVGSALGSFVAPGLGTAIGGKARQHGGQAPRGRGARDDGRGRGRARGRAPLRALGRRHGPQRDARTVGVPPRTVARSAAVTSARSLRPGAAPPAVTDAAAPSGARVARPAGRPPAAWAPPAAYRPARPCTCGAVPAGRLRAVRRGDGSASREGYETQESPSTEVHGLPGGTGGRWYRRGNRIVLVGA